MWIISQRKNIITPSRGIESGEDRKHAALGDKIPPWHESEQAEKTIYLMLWKTNYLTPITHTFHSFKAAIYKAHLIFNLSRVYESYLKAATGLERVP